jgi:hypothetical protein
VGYDDNIEGSCNGTEHCIVDTKQCAEECFISLEMECAESEQSRSTLEKQFDGLTLKVHRMKRVLERDNMANSQGKSDIIRNT